MHIDRLVYEIRELAVRAQSATNTWIDAYTRYSEEDDWESNHPNTDRKVLVFLNGHVELGDFKGRDGGAWGIDFGYYDHDKNYWRVGGMSNRFVTHWKELPPPPERVEVS